MLAVSGLLIAVLLSVIVGGIMIKLSHISTLLLFTYDARLEARSLAF